MAEAADLIPEVQTEPHTCGLHSLRSIYRSFGLEPDDYRLRARLGVDNPGLALDQNSTGTIQPDLYRVLDQDGFAFVADFSKQAKMDAVYRHLASGHPVMALIQREETEGMHWIVLQQLEPETKTFTVCDSLAGGELQFITADAEWTRRLLGTVRIQPRGQGSEARSPWSLHAAGLRDMGRTYRRSQEVFAGGRGFKAALANM